MLFLPFGSFLFLRIATSWFTTRGAFAVAPSYGVTKVQVHRAHSRCLAQMPAWCIRLTWAAPAKTATFVLRPSRAQSSKRRAPVHGNLSIACCRLLHVG